MINISLLFITVYVMLAGRVTELMHGYCIGLSPPWHINIRYQKTVRVQPDKMLRGYLVLDYIVVSHAGGVAILLVGFMLQKPG